MLHNFLIRHFKTEKEKIDYANSNEEAKPFIDTIVEYINKYNITEVNFHTSKVERVLLTALILYINLTKHVDSNIVSLPKIKEELNRDPKKKRCEEIGQYFKNANKYYEDEDDVDTHKLNIYVTHSSCYHSIYKGLLYSVTNNEDRIKHILKGKRVHSNSISYINNFDRKALFFNKDLKA